MTNEYTPIPMDTPQAALPSPILPNTYYETAPDGTEYFCCGKNRIIVSEHFAENGKPIGELIRNVIRYASRNTTLSAITL